MRLALIIGLAWLCACDAPGGPDAAARTPSFLVEGRVVDDRGEGLPRVQLRLIDTTRLSGHVDSRGCGTYYPEQRVETDATGRFSASLPFQPTSVIAWGDVPWHHFRDSMVDVEPGKPILLTIPFVPHHEVHGQVVDEDGQPIADARIEAASARTGDDGRFSVEIPDDGPNKTRVRRMGYRPLVVPFADAGRIVLPRRSMVTVTVLDPKSGAPIDGAARVSLWRGEEQFSFCTAGDPSITHEPAVGECTLDAEPGAVEVRVDDVKVSTLRLSKAPVSVRVKAPPPREPPASGGY